MKKKVGVPLKSKVSSSEYFLSISWKCGLTVTLWQDEEETFCLQKTQKLLHTAASLRDTLKTLLSKTKPSRIIHQPQKVSSVFGHVATWMLFASMTDDDNGETLTLTEVRRHAQQTASSRLLAFQLHITYGVNLIPSRQDGYFCFPISRALSQASFCFN